MVRRVQCCSLLDCSSDTHGDVSKKTKKTKKEKVPITISADCKTCSTHSHEQHPSWCLVCATLLHLPRPLANRPTVRIAANRLGDSGRCNSAAEGAEERRGEERRGRRREGEGGQGEARPRVGATPALPAPANAPPHSRREPNWAACISSPF